MALQYFIGIPKPLLELKTGQIIGVDFKCLCYTYNMSVGNTKTGSGYTIIEVMIFLAVSGMMFAIAANFINGKQANAEFNQGMSQFASELQQSINDVGNGYYTSGEDVTCSIDAITSKPKIVSAGGTSERGSNQACVFLGKLVQFKANGDDQYYKVSVIAARKSPSTATSITDVPKNYTEADPTISDTLLTETKKLRWGMKVDNVSSSSTADIPGFAIVKTFAAGTEGGGSQSSRTIPIETATYGTPLTTISGANLDTWAATNSGVKICLIGGNGKYGRISIGVSGNKAVVKKEILGSTAC